MKKKFVGLSVLLATLITVLMICNKQGGDSSSLLERNVEALTNPETGRPPEWWDFFNNYVVEKWVAYSKTDCTTGFVTIDGITIGISNCHQHSVAIVHVCYDGGDRDECIKTKVVAYI